MPLPTHLRLVLVMYPALLSSERLLFADTRLYTLPCWSVHPSVRQLRIILKVRAVFALQPLSNRPRLSCSVSGLVALLLLPNHPRLVCRVSGFVKVKAFIKKYRLYLLFLKIRDSDVECIHSKLLRWISRGETVRVCNTSLRSCSRCSCRLDR